MITLYLIWTLFGGQVQDVNAYTHKDLCERDRTESLEMLKHAQEQRPELKALTLSACIPVQVPEPK